MPAIEIGARFTGVTLDEDEAIAIVHYELIERDGSSLGPAGTVRVPFATLDLIDARLGGTVALTREQRIDLVAKLVPPVWGGSIVPTWIPPALAERRDVSVHCHGVVVAAGDVFAESKGA